MLEKWEQIFQPFNLVDWLYFFYNAEESAGFLLENFKY